MKFIKLYRFIDVISISIFCLYLSFSEDYDFMHCRGHPGGEKLNRVSGSKLYRIISYPDWKIGGAEFRKQEDFGVKIVNAGEFLPSTNG